MWVRANRMLVSCISSLPPPPPLLFSNPLSVPLTAHERNPLLSTASRCTLLRATLFFFFFFIYIYKDFFRKGEGEKNYLKTYQNHAFICVYTHVSYLSRKRYAIFRNINIHSLIPCTSGVGDRAKSPPRTDEKNLGRDLLLFSQSYF